MIADLQAWLIACLAGDAALKADLGEPARVYDTVPAGRQLPCVLLRRIEASDWGTADMAGQALIATLDIWSRAGNRAEVYRIADRIASALSVAERTAGHTNIVLAHRLTEAFTRERDQDAFFGRMRFRFLCEPVGG